jgi:tRNA1(Val) A37 N6-methylase TrmN6
MPDDLGEDAFLDGRVVPEGFGEDALLDGRVRLLQRAGGHRAGTDAVLLAAASPVRAGDRVIDVGAATGAVGLMIAARQPAASFVFVERDPVQAALCRRNLALNGVAGEVAELDLLERRSWGPADLVPEAADLVVTNPPYLDAAQARVSPDPGRADAHVLPEGGIEVWLRACATLLKPKGRLVLVHRADALAPILSALGRGFGGVSLRFVHPSAERPAVRLLLAATKGSRGPLGVEPPLVLHGADGRFTPQTAALHRGEATLA